MDIESISLSLSYFLFWQFAEGKSFGENVKEGIDIFFFYMLIWYDQSQLGYMVIEEGLHLPIQVYSVMQYLGANRG